MTDKINLEKKVKEYENYIEMLNSILDTTNEWFVAVDVDARITMMSKGYKEFLKVTNVIGKPVSEVIENTRLDKVVKTGIKEVGQIQEIKDNRVVAMRIPIKKDDKIIGAIGKVMFKDIEDFYALSKKLSNLEKEVDYYKKILNPNKQANYSIDDIIGESEIIDSSKNVAIKAAKTDSTVLITGESGTGKELFAHAIHNASKRKLSPFVKINCAAIPSELLESELFGYIKGSFSGANSDGKIGKFQSANGGTILLDEIGDMPFSLQSKLLRVLQDKEIEKIGSNDTEKIDVRVIASTNKNLEDMVKNGKFREDLYYRLNVIRLELPSLRYRKEDIESLANYLRKKIAERLGIYVEGISKEAIKILESYSWPGNIRELENIIERSINMLDSDLIILPHHFPSRLYDSTSSSVFKIEDSMTLDSKIKIIEEKMIKEALANNNGNKSDAAKVLGISRPSLYKKMKMYGLSV
ncbi:sigma-54 interaction domain-containing protein [Helicovermis profundi]|uniref:Sigma 54-interacting transcriptional regulator n=1 Tax=Helicovermis profundi TaxID=3065157 RepID=A0AAU9E541_9FIRM|nr:sigma 54-interacting transcriptional regulator [Clostridia bacterium S502]